jgi:hypothetical protein
MSIELKPIQQRCLVYLKSRQYATPAEIGYAIALVQKRPGGMKAQGAGRLGGMIASQLVTLGLAEIATTERDGFPAYRISPAGKNFPVLG